MSLALQISLYLAVVFGVLLGVGLLLRRWVDRRGLAGAARAGDRVVRGRAAAHVALVARTVLVRAEPAAVTGAVSPVLADHSRFALFDPADPEPGEHAAWAADSFVTPGLPRLAVRASPTPGWTEFGAVAYAWKSRFPQGGRYLRRVLPQVLDALRAAGLEVVEVRREFTVPLTGATSDGVRAALPLGASGPGTALDAAS